MINIQEILEKHNKWINREDGGKRADLYGAYLCGANLRRANLSGADLGGANLSYADLSYANLRGANLRVADLCGANLFEANLSEANLRRTDLSYTDLYGADLRKADLRRANLSEANLCRADLFEANLSEADIRGANLDGADLKNIKYGHLTSFYAISCPEEGSFIGFKKCEQYIVKLRITENAKRCSATSRKCRCSEAEVLSITNIDGTTADITSISSNYDPDFIYKIGEIVHVDHFDENRWNECSKGIHFFISREEAVEY